MRKNTTREREPNKSRVALRETRLHGVEPICDRFQYFEVSTQSS